MNYDETHGASAIEKNQKAIGQHLRIVDEARSAQDEKIKALTTTVAMLTGDVEKLRGLVIQMMASR